MKKCIVLISGMFLLSISNMIAQDLSQHQWKNRLLLVYTDNVQNKIYQEQIKLLKNNKRGTEDRKLIIYQFNGHKSKKGLIDSSAWQLAEKDNQLKYFSMPQDKFEIVLVGLDGGIKLRQHSVLDIETLFSTIDSMPMRRQELSNPEKKR